MRRGYQTTVLNQRIFGTSITVQRPIGSCFLFHIQKECGSDIKNRCQTLTMSTFSQQSNSSHDSQSNMQADKAGQALTLKQLVRPFIMNFHPDRQGRHSTILMREVNLKAIQTVNGMIDVVDQIHARAVDPLKVKIRGRIELERKYTVEFLVKSSTDRQGIKKPKNETVSTRRSVDLIFSEQDRNSVQVVDIHGNYSIIAAKSLRVRAMKEIAKLLRVAGLQVPTDLNAQLDKETNDISRSDADLTPHERMLRDEFNIGRRENQRQMSPYERSRKNYMSQIDWRKHEEMYQSAMEDMKRDIATQGLIEKNEERKQRLIAQVISNIRIHDSADKNSNDYESLDALHQLIAIRRLSLLFYDNFGELEMEDMSRIWENTLIVLTSARKSHEEGKKGLPYSRLRRLKEGRESGFKFSYNSNDTVTIFIPIDFLDDEILGELKRHLSDFYSILMARDGFEDYFPSVYKEFEGDPNFD
jgi:hypothetical protein